MRIVVWNVAKNSQADLPLLRALEPDVAVVPECSKHLQTEDDESMAWCGRSEWCGLAVIGFGAYDVKRYGRQEIVDEWVMPVTVKGPTTFRLLAVWADMTRSTMRAFEGTPDPVGPLRRGLRANKQFLRKGPTVVAGDFNNHPRWDAPLQSWNHSYAMADLASFGLHSAYHAHRGIEPGDEAEEPTFYMHKNRTKPYHIDWCFTPTEWAIDDVQVGGYETYSAKGGPSDHAPLIVEVGPTRENR